MPFPSGLNGKTRNNCDIFDNIANRVRMIHCCHDEILILIHRGWYDTVSKASWQGKTIIWLELSKSSKAGFYTSFTLFFIVWSLNQSISKLTFEKTFKVTTIWCILSGFWSITNHELHVTPFALKYKWSIKCIAVKGDRNY